MLRKLRRFHNTIFGTLAIIMLVTSMIGFGVNISSKSDRSYAIRVNGEEVSFDIFERALRSFEERYRAQFGDQYDSLLQAMNINVSQAVADNIVVDVLLKQLGNRLGFTVSDTEVASEITKNLSGQLSSYEDFLDQIGMSATKFENVVREDLLKQKVSSIISDVAIPFDTDIKNKATRNLTKYDINYFKIDPEKFVYKVPDPTQEQLTAFYESNKMKFEEPERVAYSYVILDGNRVKDSIKVDDEAISQYYETHQRLYKIADSAKVSLIRLNFSKDSQDSTKEVIEKKANEIFKELEAGAVMADLAKKYSEDSKTKDIGGDLGWIEEGKADKEINEAVFKSEPEFKPQIIKREESYDIIRIDDYKIGDYKPLQEVKNIIEDELKKDEIPAYLANEAQEIFSAWSSSPDDLSKFSNDRGLSVLTSDGLKRSGQDPTKDIKGLTTKILQTVDQHKQLIELDDKYFLVEVVDSKPRLVPSLEEIKNSVIESYKEVEAIKMANEKANTLVATLKDGKNSLKELVSSEEVAQEKGVSYSSGEGIFKDKTLRDQLFSDLNLINSENLSTESKIIKDRSLIYVASIINKVQPSAESVNAESLKVRGEYTAQEGNVLLSSVLNKLKSDAETDMDTSILLR